MNLTELAEHIDPQEETGMVESGIPAAVFAKEARRYGEAVESAPLRVEQLEEKLTRAASAAELPTPARKDVKISLDQPLGIGIDDDRSITHVTPGSQAAAAGIEIGDQLAYVGHQNVAGENQQDVCGRIKLLINTAAKESTLSFNCEEQACDAKARAKRCLARLRARNIMSFLNQYFEHTAELKAIAISSDGSTVAAGGSDNKAIVYDIASKETLATFEHTAEVKAIAMSSDGSTVAAGGWDNKAVVYDVASKEMLATFEHTAEVYAIAMSSDGSTVAAGGYDKKAVVYDVASKETLATFEHTAAVNAIAMSSDGSTVAAGGSDKKAVVYDVASKETLATFEHTSTVNAIASSSDGSTVAAGGVDNKAVVYDVASKEALATFEHTSMVNAIAMSSDGSTLDVRLMCRRPVLDVA
jgi:hypothetical protein